MLLRPGDGGGHGSYGMLRPTAGQLSHTHCCCAGLRGESKTNDSWALNHCQDCRGREQVAREACKTSPDSQSLERTRFRSQPSPT